MDPLQYREYSPNSWGELFYKELSVYPIPSYPALLHEDTTSWNYGRPRLHTSPQGIIKTFPEPVRKSKDTLEEAENEAHATSIAHANGQVEAPGAPKGPPGGTQRPQQGIGSPKPQFTEVK